MPTYNGKNSLRAKNMFIQRTQYQNNGYNFEVAPIDLWNEKKLYGKIAPDGSTIYPIASVMKRIESAAESENLFVLNFVADAFEDMRQEYILTQKFNAEGSIFEDLFAQKGYDNPLLKWESYSGKIINAFTEEWLSFEKRDEKIVTFKDYIMEFELFMRNFAHKMPLTLTNYLLTSAISPLSSGLMIELANADHGNDTVKSIFYTKNECFTCYTVAAQKHGFKIDKNAPWRLVADLKSPFMKPYLQRYNQSFESMFKNYYIKTYTAEIQLIKELLLASYLNFITDSPYIHVYQYYGKCKKTLQKIIERELITEAQMNEQFPDPFWAGYYIQLLHNESPNILSDSDILNLTSTVQTLVRKNEIETAYKIIFEKFNNPG
jgi:hypothetical protein